MAWYGKGHGKGGPPPSGPPGRDDIVKADIGNAIKGKDKSEWKSKLMTPQNIFLIVGSILLIMLSVVPVWNAIVLLQDRNYIFWAGRSTPAWIISACVLLVPLYAISILLFFRRATGSVHTEQTIMMVANIFITLFGLILMMASLPLTHQAEITYTNLIHRCDYSEQTHRLYEYSQVLHNIRAQPECMKKYSVEECKGYEEAPPYTSFLKGMENNFRCSGFCYRTWQDHTKQDAAAAEDVASLATGSCSALSRRLALSSAVFLNLLPIFCRFGDFDRDCCRICLLSRESCVCTSSLPRDFVFL